MNTTQNPSPRFPTNFVFFTLFTFLLSSCPQPNGSAPKNNPVNPAKPDRTLVVFDNTHGLCTALVYDDYRRRSEDKIAEVPAGRRSTEIEYYPGDSAPFYFAYVISLNDFSGYTMNYVPKNGMDQRTVNVAANKTTTVLIPKLDETFSKKDQLLSARSFLLLQNASNYSFELHQGRSSVKPDSAVSSPVVNSAESAFYTIDPKAALNYMLLVGADYKDFPKNPANFEPGHFYNFTYNGNIVFNNEIPVNLDNIAIKTYTVKFNANGANGTAPTAQVANAGSAVTLPNSGGMSKEGYTFGGWNASETGTEINYGAGATYTVTSDISLYATWYPIGTVMYTVDFESDGGSATASQDIVSGKQAFRPADPIRRGNIFIDWYADPGFNNVYDFSKPVTGAITVYAKWEAIKYTVTFNANGANGTTPASQTANALSSITLPNGNSLSKTGFGFGGWSVDDSGGETYGGGGSFTVENDITLFAVWNLLPYTVNFYSNGGSAVQSQSVTYGSEAARPADPVRNGYIFIGWYNDTSLTEEYDFSNTVTSNVTLYAKWSSLVNGIRLNKSTLAMDVNETETLTASMNTGNALIDTITWSSNNTLVATVSQNGQVSAIRAGTVIISASAGLQTAQCEVTVTSIAAAIAGVSIPAIGRIPSTAITETAQYTGTVVWDIKDNPFKFDVVYTATITIRAKTGYTLERVSANFFTVAGAASVSNTAGSGLVTAVFPPASAMNNSDEELQTYLSGLPANTATTPYFIALNVDSLTGIADILKDNSTKYVSFDLSGSNITGIEAYTFRDCTSLTGVTIPDSVTSIGNGAFAYCTSLANVTIPDSITTIGASAFSRCDGLATVTIGNGVTSIGSSAFSSCTSLASVTIPNSVTTIGDLAFLNCASLTGINVGTANTAYSSDNGVLYNKDKTTLIAYPGGKIGAFTIPNGVTSIVERAFSFCSLSGVTIPDSITIIEPYTFNDCANLTSVTIGNNVTIIGSVAFNNCTSLTSINIPNSVTSIGEYSFKGCTSLVNVTIPNSVTTIGRDAFYGCSKLASVIIPDSVTSISDYTFLDCSSLASVIISNNVTSIGNSAFRGCTNLAGVIIPNKVTIIQGSAFYECTSLASVTIGNSVTTISGSAFMYCTSLTSITIPKSVTSIDGNAFGGCNGLTSVTFEGTIVSSSFRTTAFNGLGDLWNKFYATDSTNGTPGTYKRPTTGSGGTWTKQ